MAQPPQPIVCDLFPEIHQLLQLGVNGNYRSARNFTTICQGEPITLHHADGSGFQKVNPLRNNLMEVIYAVNSPEGFEWFSERAEADTTSLSDSAKAINIALSIIQKASPAFYSQDPNFGPTEAEAVADAAERIRQLQDLPRLIEEMVREHENRANPVIIEQGIQVQPTHKHAQTQMENVAVVEDKLINLDGPSAAVECAESLTAFSDDQFLESLLLTVISAIPTGTVIGPKASAAIKKLKDVLDLQAEQSSGTSSPVQIIDKVTFLSSRQLESRTSMTSTDSENADDMATDDPNLFRASVIVPPQVLTLPPISIPSRVSSIPTPTPLYDSSESESEDSGTEVQEPVVKKRRSVKSASAYAEIAFGNGPRNASFREARVAVKKAIAQAQPMIEGSSEWQKQFEEAMEHHKTCPVHKDPKSRIISILHLFEPPKTGIPEGPLPQKVGFEIKRAKQLYNNWRAQSAPKVTTDVSREEEWLSMTDEERKPWVELEDMLFKESLEQLKKGYIWCQFKTIKKAGGPRNKKRKTTNLSC